MSRVRFLSGLSVALALVLAACGDFTSSGDPLSESEAAELAEGLVEGGFVGFDAPAAAPMGAPGEAAARVTVTLNDTAPCDDAGGAGTVTVVGSVTVDVNQTTQAGTFDFSYTIAPHGCRVTAEGGKVFTIDGDPNLKVAGNFTWGSTAADGELTYDGKFKWAASDGRAGACGVNLKATYHFSFGTTGSSGTATLNGTVCGFTVNRSISVEA